MIEPIIKTQDAEEKEYGEAFDQAIKESDSAGRLETLQQHTSELAQDLGKEFDQSERDRRQVEERWLKDLRQHRAEYDPEVKAALHPKRSQSYFSLTKSKVKTVSSRMMDMFFPANGDKNWGINPTPIPELNQELINDIIEQMVAQTGEEPKIDDIKQMINQEAKRRCEEMQKEMEDQLGELKYREIISNIIKSGNIYGTGILKGPLVQKQMVKRWLPGKDGEWVTVQIPKYLPHAEFVPIWDIYPDMTAKRPEDLRFIFQRYVMNRKQCLDLASREDFKGDAIKAYLEVYKDGDAEFKNHEESLRGLSSGNETPSEPHRNRGKFEVKEFWGYLSTERLKGVGVEVNEEEVGPEVAANVWLLGDMVIKAIVSPIQGSTFPYYWYYYDKDETSIWGEGIPYIMRDPQTNFNAAIRAMLDNAAISAGPIIEANISLLAQKEDPTDLYPFRVFQRDGMGIEASQRAITVTSLPSYTREYLEMIRFFLESADEITAVPRYLYGDNSQMQGAGRTATGLSMLMGASFVVLKDQAKNFDEGITKPFIKALYFWNMDFNTKESIKGDYSVECKGSTSLIAKEVRAENLNQFLAITGNEVFMPYINLDVALREVAKTMDLEDAGLIKDPDTVRLETDARNKQVEEDRQFEMEMARQKAESGGHVQKQRPTMERVPQDELQQGTIPEVMGV